MRTPTHRSLPAIFLLMSVATALCGCNTISGHFTNKLATTYYKLGHYTMARHAFHRAAIDSPQNADYIHNLAWSLKKQGDLAGAEQSFRHALNVNPGHQPSYHSLATLLKDQHREPEALELAQTWVDTQPYAAGAHVEMAWLKRELGDTAGAELALQNALQVQPNHPVALAHLGQLYQDTGQHNRAVAMYQRSLHNHWYQPEVHSRLASIRESSGMGQNSPRFALQGNRPLISYGAATGSLGPLVWQSPVSASPQIAGGLTPSPGLAAQSGQSFAPVGNSDPAHSPFVGSAVPADPSY